MRWLTLTGEKRNTRLSLELVAIFAVWLVNFCVPLNLIIIMASSKISSINFKALLLRSNHHSKLNFHQNFHVFRRQLEFGSGLHYGLWLNDNTVSDVWRENEGDSTTSIAIRSEILCDISYKDFDYQNHDALWNNSHIPIMYNYPNPNFIQDSCVYFAVTNRSI